MVCKSLGWWSSNISCQTLLPLPQVHGTFLHAWLRIRHEGLKTMGRNHIHMCTLAGSWSGWEAHSRRNPTTWQVRFTAFEFNDVYNLYTYTVTYMILKMIKRECAVIILNKMVLVQPRTVSGPDLDLWMMCEHVIARKLWRFFIIQNLCTRKGLVVELAIAPQQLVLAWHNNPNVQSTSQSSN